MPASSFERTMPVLQTPTFFNRLVRAINRDKIWRRMGSTARDGVTSSTRGDRWVGEFTEFSAGNGHDVLTSECSGPVVCGVKIQCFFDFRGRGDRQHGALALPHQVKCWCVFACVVSTQGLGSPIVIRFLHAPSPAARRHCFHSFIRSSVSLLHAAMQRQAPSRVLECLLLLLLLLLLVLR